MGELEVHHHDRRREKFYSLGAVRTLCRSCHIKLHRGERRTTDPGRLAWAKLLEEMA